MQCSYCPQDMLGKAYDGPRLMSMETFETCISNTPDNVPVSFAGLAEPYLNRLTTSMVIRTAVKHKRKIKIYTTGVGMFKSDVHALHSLPKDSITRIVLHLPDAGGDMKANVNDKYIESLNLLFALFPDAQAVCFGELHPRLSQFKHRLRRDNMITRAGNVIHMTTPKQLQGPLACSPAPDLKNNVLLPNGDLIVCCQDYGLRHVIGNLLEQTWDEVHASSRMKEFKELMRESTPDQCLCRTCEYARPA